MLLYPLCLPSWCVACASPLGVWYVAPSPLGVWHVPPSPLDVWHVAPSPLGVWHVPPSPLGVWHVPPSPLGVWHVPPSPLGVWHVPPSPLGVWHVRVACSTCKLASPYMYSITFPSPSPIPRTAVLTTKHHSLCRGRLLSHKTARVIRLRFVLILLTNN